MTICGIQSSFLFKVDFVDVGCERVERARWVLRMAAAPVLFNDGVKTLQEEVGASFLSVYLAATGRLREYHVRESEWDLIL